MKLFLNSWCQFTYYLTYINLYYFQVSTLVNLSSSYLNGGREAKRLGTAHASIVPYETFKTADGYFTIGRLDKVLFVIVTIKILFNYYKKQQAASLLICDFGYVFRLRERCSIQRFVHFAWKTWSCRRCQIQNKWGQGEKQRRTYQCMIFLFMDICNNDFLR